MKTFQRLKPDHIIKPKLNGRDTYLCIKRANFEFWLTALHANKIIDSNRLSDICKSVCCNTENKSCMYQVWSKCQSEKAFTINSENCKKSVTYE